MGEIKDLSKEDRELLEKLGADQRLRRKVWLESWGASPNEITAAEFAYKSFIEKEQRGQKTRSFYATPLAQSSFMCGWILSRREL